MVVALVTTTVTAAGAATDPVLNEFVFNHTGTDTAEFDEMTGDPSTDYSAFTVIEIEGDSTASGTVDGTVAVGETTADGYWVTAPLSDELENGTVSLLLVEGFSGAAGDDLDSDNDGTGLPGFLDTLAPGEARNTPGAVNSTEPGGGGSEIGACGDAATPIHAVQGSGPTSPIAGTTVVVEAVVVGDFQNNDQPGDGELDGFHLQEEDAQAIALRRVTLDDGLSVQNPDRTRHPDGGEFTLDHRFRGGDAVSGAIARSQVRRSGTSTPTSQI